MTAWVDLPDILMSIQREVVTAKLTSFRDGLARALDAALLLRTSAVPPAAVRAAESPGAETEAPA